MPIVLHAESMKFGPGGQTIRLVEEARRINERDDWTCYVAGQAGGPLRNAIHRDSNYFSFDFGSFRLNPRAISRAVRMLRSVSPDIVHTHSSQDAWIFGIAARLTGIPVVRGRHASHPIPAKRIRQLVYTHLADAFTVSGSTIGRLLLDAGVAQETQVFDTAGGFDPMRFSRTNRDAGFLRRELQIDEDARIIGAACTVRPSKGVDILVKAFALLRESAPHLNAHLVVSGEVSDQDRKDLAAQVPERIHFLGFRKDVDKVLGGMDLLVMPSRCADGVPQVIPQAMALGVPVVGTCAGGIPDAIVHGESGVLVDPEDPTALMEAIHSVLCSDEEDLNPMLERAHARSHRFTFDRVVETYFRAYESVLANTSEANRARAA